MKYFVCAVGVCAVLFWISPAFAAGAVEASRLLQTFRTTKNPRARDAAFDELIQLDAKIVAQLSRAIDALLARERAAYLKMFAKQAGRIGDKRVKTIRVEEVKALRAEVLALSALGEQLTGEMLKEKAVPALDRLRQLMMVDTADVWKDDAKLSTQRKRLLSLGKQKQQCEAALAAAAADEQDKSAVDFDKQLAEDEAAATIESMPIPPASKAVFAANAKLAARIDPQSFAAMRECNLTRALLGLNALAIDARLIKAAEMHSADMEKHKFFDHISPVPGRQSPLDRARLAGTTVTAENIYSSEKPVTGTHVSGVWFASPQHHINMLRPSQRIGVGRHGLHYTELFGS
jgi:uncharacterized protein YkwD